MLASQVVLSKMGDKCAEDNELFFQFCEKYKIPAQKGIFVSGTMFIARANCFEIIKQIKLSENDFLHYSILTEQKLFHIHLREYFLE